MTSKHTLQTTSVSPNTGTNGIVSVADCFTCNVGICHVDFEKLSSSIRTAIEKLATGFLQHSDNASFRDGIVSDSANAQQLFQQTTYAVFRLCVLFVMHEHRAFDCLLNTPIVIDTDEQQLSIRRIFAQYSDAVTPSGTRKRAKRKDFSALWSTTSKLFACLSAPCNTSYDLGGIFRSDRCATIAKLHANDKDFILALSSLFDAGFTVDCAKQSGITPSHLGLVYPYLLQFLPDIDLDARQFKLVLPPSKHQSSRKSSGSYYTPDKLIQTVIERAVGPLVKRIVSANADSPLNAAIELQNLRIVDPACGCGHFIAAAARYLASHLARCRCQGDPSSADIRHALFDVLTNCIYGVDLDPVAVDLCQLNLWWHTNDPSLSIDAFDQRIRWGNSLIGAPSNLTPLDIPEAVRTRARNDDTSVSDLIHAKGTLKPEQTVRTIGADEISGTRTNSATPEGDLNLAERKWLCDLWCAECFLPDKQLDFCTLSLTEARLDSVHYIKSDAVNSDCVSAVSKTGFDTAMVDALRNKYAFFHWHVEYPEVFSRGGFDAVIGNPPWIAHVGRAAKRLAPRVALFYTENYDGFSRYRTTHGLFASVMPTWLRIGGQLGLVVPAGICDLDGYEPTRRAHDRLCDFREELVDFGEGRFANVTQPCVALVSERADGGRSDGAPGSPWPLERPDLCDADILLLKLLAKLPRIDNELFGERGLQSDRAMAKHICKCSTPHGRFQTPLREGTDVREFELLAPRYYIDRNAIVAHTKRLDAMVDVPIVLRQTARYPIAALSDGIAFRNSLLAGFRNSIWSAPALVALLNSSLIRWHHYHSFRDARQPMLPQVKIGHLRQIPIPRRITDEAVRALEALGGNEPSTDVQTDKTSDTHDGVELKAQARILRRDRIDRVVTAMYELTQEQHDRVTEWHRRIHGNGR